MGVPKKSTGQLLAGASVELVGKLMGAGQTPGESWEAACGEVELGGKPVRIPEEPNQEAACWVLLGVEQRSVFCSASLPMPQQWTETPPASAG